MLPGAFLRRAASRLSKYETKNRGQVLQSNTKRFRGAGLGLRADAAGGAGPRRGSGEMEGGN